MRAAIFLESNLRKANKRFGAIQARESRAFVETNGADSIGRHDPADRIAAGPPFRYTYKLLRPC
jgi:hypothetical protein